MEVSSQTTPERDMRVKIINEPWISVTEVAAHLGIKPDTVYKWLERRQIPAHKVGRLWKFRFSDIDSWVLSGQAKRGSVMVAREQQLKKKSGK